MLNWTRLHWPNLNPSTSTLLWLMQLSPTRPTRRDTSAHSRLSTHLSTLRRKRALVTHQTMLLLSYTPRDSKISQSSKDLVISSEFTEPLLDFTMVKDNTTPTFSITVHGLSSQLTRNQLSKKSVVLSQPMNLPHSLTQESTSLLRRTKLPLFKTLESGLNNTSPNTMLSPPICTPPWTRLNHTREISMSSQRSSKFSNSTNTPMNSSLRMLQVKFSTLLPLSSSSHTWELARLSESDQLLMTRLPPKRRFLSSNTTLTFSLSYLAPNWLRT